MRDHAHDAPAAARTAQKMTTPETGLPVRVWLTNRNGDFQADGEAVAWTSSQVRVHYVDRAGREGWVWVWATAVERR